jgi:hypothetical protein
MRKFAFTLLLLLAACGPSGAPEKKEDKDAGPGVSLSAEEVKGLGIETVVAPGATFQKEVTGYGIVTALDAIAQTDADYLTASAAATQSAAAASRARSLGTGDEAAVSREVVEVAASKAAADQAALALARRKADAVFGIHAPWQNAAERTAIMARLGSGKTTLVHVTFPLGALGRAAPDTVKITRLGADTQSWISRKVWDAPSDPAFPGRGFYTLVDGSDLAQNEHVIAAIAVGAPESGIAVPASALLMGEGEASVYVETGDKHFLRTRIDTGKPMANGYFVRPGAGIAPGQKVVTSGAGLLLSHEINPSSGAED